MRYQDVVYGALDIPAEIWKLFADPLLVRLRGISQAVLPVEMNPFCTAVNRFQHGIGVWHLAKRLCQVHVEFRHLDPDLPLAGLLHDAANPPFSHTGDWFMYEAIGHHGETHLKKVLLDSPLVQVLEKLGANPERICELVAGRLKPWSDLLNGTLDLDNLDNLRRFADAMGLDNVNYHPYRVVDAFRLSLDRTAIALDALAENEVWAWQRARKIVYAAVYAEPHLSLAMMLHRALELAHVNGELAPSFWHLTDRAAFEYIENCSAGTRTLAHSVRGLQPYHLAARWDGTAKPFEGDWNIWRVRKAVADELAETAGVKPWEAAAYVGVGNDVKRITLPFRDHGALSADTDDALPIWRIRLYLRRAAGGFTELMLKDAAEFVRQAVLRHLAATGTPVAETSRAGF